jgi:20S proteasome alpha/beta subunit
MKPPDPIVELIDNYESIGSGARYAHLLLRQQTRVLMQSGMNISDTDLKANTWLATLVINEIKTFDPATSGTTRVAFIDQDGFIEYTRKQVIERYESTTGEFVDLAVKFGIDRETARSIFPEA